MATNKIFEEDARTNRARVVPLGTKSGDFLIVDGVPCVAITDRGDAERTFSLGPIGKITVPSGGASLASNEATVATTGTWELTVDGADKDTGQGVEVFWDDTKKELTLTSTGNTAVGVTDYPVDYARTDDVAPVRIGAPN